MYSKILNLPDCVVPGDSGPSSQSLEPGKVIENVPKDLVYGKERVVVLISDNLVTVELELSVFLYKAYPIHQGKLCIGSRKIQMNNLSIFIGLKYNIEDLSGMIDLSVD